MMIGGWLRGTSNVNVTKGYWEERMSTQANWSVSMLGVI